jgi:hypothetical protein
MAPGRLLESQVPSDNLFAAKGAALIIEARGHEPECIAPKPLSHYREFLGDAHG